MIISKQNLANVGVDVSTLTSAMYSVRTMVTANETDVLKGAGLKLVNKLLGASLTASDLRVPNASNKAQVAAFELFFAQAVVEGMFKLSGQTKDVEDVIYDAQIRARNLTSNKELAFLFKEAEVANVRVETVQLIADVDVKVEMKDDGKGGQRIKNGGRQVLARELYKVRVLEATQPLSNKEFIDVLVKELGMTKPGATTYAYNAKKFFAA